MLQLQPAKASPFNSTSTTMGASAASIRVGACNSNSAATNTIERHCELLQHRLVETPHLRVVLPKREGARTERVSGEAEAPQLL